MSGVFNKGLLGALLIATLVVVQAKADWGGVFEVSSTVEANDVTDAKGRYYAAYSYLMYPEMTYQFRLSRPRSYRGFTFLSLRVLDDKGTCLSRAGGILNFWPEKEGIYTIVVSTLRAGRKSPFQLNGFAQPAKEFVFEEADRTLSAIKKLDVEYDPIAHPGSTRVNPYLPRGGATFCNVFAADVAAKLGEPLPLQLTYGGSVRSWLLPWYDAREQATETLNLNANAMQDWLVHEGPAQGWKQIGRARHKEAQRFANRGYLVLATWQKGRNWTSGHMAVVRPHAWSSGSPATKGPYVAQTGARGKNKEKMIAAEGFPGSILANVIYFYHDRKLLTWTPRDTETDLDIPMVEKVSRIGELAPSQPKPKPRPKPIPKPIPQPQPDQKSKLGIAVVELPATMKKLYGIKTSGGVMVTKVQPDSPAARSGVFRLGTVITGVGIKAVLSPQHFKELIDQRTLKKGIPLVIVNKDKKRRLVIIRE